MRLIITRDGCTAAWSAEWYIDQIEGHKLLAVPRLRLSHEVALELSQRIPYAHVFRAAIVSLGEDPPRRLVVVHATFDLYRTSEPDISNFAALVPNPESSLPLPSHVIEKTAEMLRGKKS